MKIQNFIFTWNQFVPNAIDIESKISKYGKTRVINSNVNEKRDHWINLNDGYFAEQWSTLISNIDDDTDYKYLLKMPMDSVSEENVKKIMKDKDTKESELLQIQNMSIHQMWLNELTILETELEKFASSAKSSQSVSVKTTKVVKKKKVV